MPPAVVTRVFPATVRSEAKRLVDDAVVEKKFVVVALDPVALRKVKFWRVDDPVARRFANERVPVAVMFAAEMFPEMSAFPCTERVCDGVVVPIPKFPEASIVVLV